MLGVGESVVALTVILWVSELQCFWLSQISWKLSFLCDPVILGVPEHLGVGLPLSLIKVVAEPLPQICSAHWFRPEGTRVPGWAGDPASLDPRETSYSRCWRRCYGILTSDPVWFIAPVSWASPGCFRTGIRARAKVCSEHCFRVRATKIFLIGIISVPGKEPSRDNLYHFKKPPPFIQLSSPSLAYAFSTSNMSGSGCYESFNNLTIPLSFIHCGTTTELENIKIGFYISFSQFLD